MIWIQCLLHIFQFVSKKVLCTRFNKRSWEKSDLLNVNMGQVTKFLGNACAITGSQNQNKQIEMQRRIQIITLDFFFVCEE